ncbi:MAG: sensor histidine kinase [Caulobacteraceae bacterium]
MIDPTQTEAGLTASMALAGSEDRGEEELLRHETHHRLQNTFAIMYATLQRELRTPAPCVRTTLERSARMVLAHSDLHRCLVVGARGGRLAVGDYISELCHSLSRAVLEPSGIRCEVSVAEGQMEAYRCERLGLIICELVLNAAKHAFPIAFGGMVEVELAPHQGGWRCVVRDNGIGRIPSSARGVGSQLVHRLVERLGGDVLERASHRGTSITILLPEMSDTAGEGRL